MNSLQRDLERIYDRWGAALFTCALGVTGCRNWRRTPCRKPSRGFYVGSALRKTQGLCVSICLGTTNVDIHSDILRFSDPKSLIYFPGIIFTCVCMPCSAICGSAVFLRLSCPGGNCALLPANLLCLIFLFGRQNGAKIRKGFQHIEPERRTEAQ